MPKQLSCLFTVLCALIQGKQLYKTFGNGAVVRWCGGAVVRWCGGAVVRWCGGAVVQWCSRFTCNVDTEGWNDGDCDDGQNNEHFSRRFVLQDNKNTGNN